MIADDLNQIPLITKSFYDISKSNNIQTKTLKTDLQKAVEKSLEKNSTIEMITSILHYEKINNFFNIIAYDEGAKEQLSHYK